MVAEIEIWAQKWSEIAGRREKKILLILVRISSCNLLVSECWGS